ncbi:MAG: hypothetical protein JSS49_05150 [Planctomycetes bacterium]|nr:hypothetical protein [Planctomycetota bacterium]
MTDQRLLKTIAARYDLEVDRHPDAWRRLRWRLSVVFAVGTIAATIPLLLGDHRAFESGCASDAHRLFGQNCQACHDRQLVPLLRMATMDNTRHSTSDHKCQVCHRETNSDHVARIEPAELANIAVNETNADQSAGQSLEQLLRPKFDAIGCAGCHQEHRGHSLLAQVADANCTDCHRTPHQISQRFQLDFGNFEAHPEFSIWRAPRETTAASFRSLVAHYKQGQPIDQSAIRFSHHRHLDPQLLDRGGQTTSLECADCHQADGGGAYFRPIQFEQHCSRCHKLGFPSTGELPHAKPEIIRGVLLDSLARNLTQPQLPAATDKLGGPTKPPIITRERENEAFDLAQLVNVQLTKLEQQLFETLPTTDTQPQRKGLLEAACTKCHFTERGADSSWKITPTRIPEQWMSHSRFRHDRHASIDCGLCHTRHGDRFQSVERVRFYPELNDMKSSSSIFASTSAQDVLLPRIEVCHQCHGQHSTQGSTTVTDRCVDCHAYHHTSSRSAARPGIEQLLNSGHPTGGDSNAPAKPEAGR